MRIVKYRKFFILLISIVLISSCGVPEYFERTSHVSKVETVVNRTITYKSFCTEKNSRVKSQHIQVISPSTEIRQNMILSCSDKENICNLRIHDDGHDLLSVKTYSELNATGELLGVLEIPLYEIKDSELTILLDATPDDIDVFSVPNNPTVDEPISIYYAGKNKNVYIPIHPDTINVTNQFNVKNENKNLMIPVAAGELEFTVSVPRLGISKNIQYDISESTQNPEWTIYLYMNSVSNLHPFSLLNVKQMIKGLVNRNVQVVLEWKQKESHDRPNVTFDGTRRFLIRNSGLSKPKMILLENLGPNHDIGDKNNMRKFINWGLENYPSNRKIFLYWGHGHGWKPIESVLENDITRLSFDHGYNQESNINSTTRFFNHDEHSCRFISIWELQEIFQGIHLDAFIWDASLMMSVEVATELVNVADFVVGSQESPPGPGFPYDKIMEDICNSAHESTESVLEHFIMKTITHGPYNSKPVEESLLCTKNLKHLNRALKSLSKVLSEHSLEIKDAYIHALNSAKKFKHLYYYDLLDFLIKMKQKQLPEAVAGSINAAISAFINSKCLIVKGNTASCDHHPSLHTEKCKRSYGISIDVSPSNVFSRFERYYDKLQFKKQTNWDAWLSVTPEIEEIRH